MRCLFTIDLRLDTLSHLDWQVPHGSFMPIIRGPHLDYMRRTMQLSVAIRMEQSRNSVEKVKFSVSRTVYKCHSFPAIAEEICWQINKLYKNISWTSIEARQRWASLLQRAGNGAQATALRWQWFGGSASPNVLSINNYYICSNGLPCNDGASSQGKQRAMTVVHRQPCHVSASSNSASNEQWSQQLNIIGHNHHNSCPSVHANRYIGNVQRIMRTEQCLVTETPTQYSTCIYSMKATLVQWYKKN